MSSQRVTFKNESGVRLAGIIDDAEGTPAAYAIFTHCFTCTKDLKAIVKISRQLAKRSISVLRFDFSGLGNSGGRFEESNFETNLTDLRAAVNWLSATHQAPQLLIGHSLGGAAAMASVGEFDSVKAIATLAAPSCTAHLAKFLTSQNPEIEATGSGMVNIGGRDHLITTQLLESLRGFNLETPIRSIQVPHLIMHSPTDATVAFSCAEDLFEWSAGAKTLLGLPGSDHLLINQRQDANWVADCVAVWAGRFFE